MERLPRSRAQRAGRGSGLPRATGRWARQDLTPPRLKHARSGPQSPPDPAPCSRLPRRDRGVYRPRVTGRGPRGPAPRSDAPVAFQGLSCAPEAGFVVGTVWALKEKNNPVSKT